MQFLAGAIFAPFTFSEHPLLECLKLGVVARRGQRDVVVREGVARFAQGAGFHLVIRPGEHFADAATDEIGDGDLRGGMEVAREWIDLPPAQQAIHFGQSVEVAFLSKVDALAARVHPSTP